MARLLVLVVSLVMFSHNKAMAQTTIAPELIEAIEGDNTTFNCSEIISLAAFTVDIQRPGDTGFSTLSISDPRLSMEEVNVTAVYTYGPVERTEDMTIFRCNLGGVRSTNFATLRVYYPPEYVNPGMQSIIEGNDFMLDLDLTANPIPEDYQWMKDGANITNGGRLTLTVDQIAIRDTVRDDAATYTLTARNVAGMDTISLNLDVLYALEPGPLGGTLAAECDSGSPMMCNIMTGDTGTLECTAAGMPTPTFEVTSNAPIQTNIGFSGATIQITNAVPGNTGLYTCSFNNSVESSTQDFQLNVAPGKVLLFQLVLSGVQDCAQWVQQDVPDKLEDVTTSVQESIEQLCTCGFTPDDITDSAFECSKINADIVSFRATLHAVNTLEYIEQWREEGPAINIQGLILRVSADSSCPVVVNSITDPLCEPTQTSTSSSEDDNTPGIIGGVIAGVVVLVCVTVVIIIAIIVAHRRIHHGTQSSSVRKSALEMSGGEAIYEEMDQDTPTVGHETVVPSTNVAYGITPTVGCRSVVPSTHNVAYGITTHDGWHQQQ